MSRVYIHIYIPYIGFKGVGSRAGGGAVGSGPRWKQGSREGEAGRGSGWTEPRVRGRARVGGTEVWGLGIRV